MAISFVAGSHALGASNTVTITKPSGTLDDDVLLCWLFSYYSGGSPTFATLTGWTALANQNTTSRAHMLFWKRAASEGADYTWTATAGGSASGAIACIRGCVLSGNPVDASSNVAYTTSDTNLRAASCTTSSPGHTVYLVGNGYPAASALPPSGWTERYDAVPGAGAPLVYLAEYLMASAGAVGQQDATLDAAGSTGKAAWLVALKPQLEQATRAYYYRNLYGI